MNLIYDESHSNIFLFVNPAQFCNKLLKLIIITNSIFFYCLVLLQIIWNLAKISLHFV